MTTRVLLATRNAGKLAELRRLLDSTLVEVVGVEAYPDLPDVAETEPSFAGNALLKARSGAVATGLISVADDSGLEVAALNGMPGVLSARWSGRHGDDVANLALLLGQLSDVPDERRGARFVCAAALVTPDGIEHVVRGEMTGRVVREPRGKNGFGYDPVFVADGYDVTTAELDDAVKDEISHRGRAMRALAPLLVAEVSRSGR